MFVKESQDYYDINLNIGLSIHYVNGKQSGITRTVNANGIQQFTLKAEEDADIKSIVGFFYYRGKKNTRNFCLIDNISLIRMHEKEAEVVENSDSVVTDSAVGDSVPELPSKRLTPEEIRRLNQTNEHINIQEAPSIRTPNRIGPRRRKK